MADNFEDARNEAEQMFTPQGELIQEETPTPVRENAPQEQNSTVPPEQQIPAEQPAVNNPIDIQIQQIMAENEQLKQANEELQKTITQQSEMQENKIEERVMPTLDFNALAFDDEETVAQKQAEYARQMAEYVKGDILKEIEPFVSRAKDGIQKDERERVFAMLEAMPDMKDIRSVAPQMDRIIENNKLLFSDDVPADDKYIAAYALAKGANIINNPPRDPSADELMEYYNKNPEFQQMIEKKRLEDIKNSQQVPPMSASSGAVNAALNIKEKPKTWEEASDRAKELFR